ncbi:hypothetical protein Ac2012v2_000459 [Leucoagaricus gongylophorus]
MSVFLGADLVLGTSSSPAFLAGSQIPGDIMEMMATLMTMEDLGWLIPRPSDVSEENNSQLPA